MQDPTFSETADDDSLLDPDEGMPIEDTDEAADDSAIPGDPAPTGTEASFFNPSQIDALNIPDEQKAQLKQTWKRMHGSFTKRMQESKGGREAMATIQRFNSDAAFAEAVLQERAKQLGYTLSRPQAAPQQAPTNGDHATGAPAQMVELVKARFPTDVQWLAPYVADAAWQMLQQGQLADTHLKPINERLERMEHERQTERQSQASADYAAIEAEMDEKYPLWREDDDDLESMLDFLRSDRMRHPRHGSKLELLYKVLKGPSLARGEMARRITQAGRNRVATGTPSRTTVDNIEERVRNPKISDHEAFRLAALAAMSQTGQR